VFPGTLQRADQVNHTWAVNLARHVEPRRVSNGQAVALMVIALLATAALAFPIFAGWQ
jgi:hypothetical protein